VRDARKGGTSSKPAALPAATVQPHRKRGRPQKVAPTNAAARIAAYAATGHALVGIARLLGTTKEVLRRWIEEDPALEEALAQGREAERFTLHNVLYRAARKGNIVAAMFLLKARHGYREGDQAEHANRVSINFTLPGAVEPEQFKVIEHDDAGHKPLALPAARLTRS